MRGGTWFFVFPKTFHNFLIYFCSVNSALQNRRILRHPWLLFDSASLPDKISVITVTTVTTRRTATASIVGELTRLKRHKKRTTTWKSGRGGGRQGKGSDVGIGLGGYTTGWRDEHVFIRDSLRQTPLGNGLCPLFYRRPFRVRCSCFKASLF